MTGKIIAPRRAYAYNLLDNSDFRNPVDQRGQTSYTADGYSVDRWKISPKNSVAEVAIGDGAVSFKGYFYQYLELDISKIYTLAACTNDGSVVCVTGVPADIASNTSGNLQVQISTNSPQTYIRAELSTVDAANAVSVLWAALYEGAYTADTLPPYVPKGYAAELAECERYFYRFDTRKLNSAAAWMMAIAWNATQARAVVHLPVIMRDIPKIEFKNIRFLQIFPESVTGLSGTFATCPVSTVKASGAFPNLYLSFTISGALAGSHGLICANDSNDAYIELSADL